MEFQFLTLKKCIAFVILLCFSFSSSAEARSPKHPNIRHANKLQTQKAAVRAKQLAAPQARAKQLRAPKARAIQIAAPQRNVRQLPLRQARAKQLRAPKVRARQIAAPQRNVRQLPLRQARAKQAAAPQRRVRQVQVPQRNVRQLPLQQAIAKQAAVPQRRFRQIQVPQRKATRLPAPLAKAKQATAQKTIVQKPAVVPVKPQINTNLSLLKPYTQRNAKLGGLDHLYSKNISGEGQTVAVIEYSGGWQEMKNVMNNKYEIVPSKINERYKRNFLTPIGSKAPGSLHPEETNHWVRVAMRGNESHASSVSSVVMDLAPQTKVKPVSTYNCFESPTQPCHFYDISDALMDLSTNKDVGIINISGGWVQLMNSEVKREYDTHGNTIYMHKTGYTPKLVEAIKAVAKARKVVVLAAGNEGKEIQPRKFEPDSHRSNQMIGYLLETLDHETRKSILIAGNIDPNTRNLCSTSNKPGNWAVAQERSVCVPGYHMLSHVDFVVKGTSYAAPYLCAVTALLSSKGYAPKRVINALLETAEKDPDKRTYGSGRMIRAGKALEYLEKGN